MGRELIEKFSKRTQLIEDFAKKHHAMLTAKARLLMKKTGMDFGDAFEVVRAEIGSRTRESKSAAVLAPDDQLANWRAQMTAEEIASLKREAVMGARCEHSLIDPSRTSFQSLTFSNGSPSCERSTQRRSSCDVESARSARSKPNAGSGRIRDPFVGARNSAGDTIRITRNFREVGQQFRNNELCAITAVDQDNITLGDGRLIKCSGPLHVDQGIVVTSFASQGKTVDQLIASVPVDAFSQVNEAQFYVTMSRARQSMHLFTDCMPALREAVCRPSERLSGLELVGEHNYAEITKQMQMEAEKMIDLNRGRGIERAIPEIDRGMDISM